MAWRPGGGDSLSAEAATESACEVLFSCCGLEGGCGGDTVPEAFCTGWGESVSTVADSSSDASGETPLLARPAKKRCVALCRLVVSCSRHGDPSPAEVGLALCGRWRDVLRAWGAVEADARRQSVPCDAAGEGDTKGSPAEPVDAGVGKAVSSGAGEAGEAKADAASAAPKEGKYLPT